MEKEFNIDEIIERFQKRRDERITIAKYRKRRDARVKFQKDAQWVENEHPREKDGTFAEKGQGESGAVGEGSKENNEKKEFKNIWSSGNVFMFAYSKVTTTHELL